MTKDYLNAAERSARAFMEATEERMALPYSDFKALATLIEQHMDAAHEAGASEPRQPVTDKFDPPPLPGD